MRKEVAQSDGGQKFDKYCGPGASENLLNTFHPVNLATTVVPVAKGFTAAKAVVNAAEQGLVRTIAGNVVRSVPEAAGYGALQHIEANPQTSGADLINGVLKNVAVTSGVTAAGGGGGEKSAWGGGDCSTSMQYKPAAQAHLSCNQ